VLEDSPTGTAAGQASGAWVVAVPNVVPLSLAPRRTVIRTLAGITPASLAALAGAAIAEA